ncbi:MAG TPA: YihY/virulence factor BrkB family protein [Urbifossiella sp.]|jgi:membrane protein|nr:YihY/virulence factor BrkB family protein [Urbifossiella sp.]
MKLSDTWTLLKRSGQEFQNDNATTLAAALAFYTALSIAPLLLLVIVIAGAVFGEQAARGEIAHQLNDLIGSEGAQAVESMLAKSQSPGGGLVSSLVGIVTLLVGATGVFSSLQTALNAAWNVTPDAGPSEVWGLVRDRLLSFTMICAMAFLLLVSLVFSALLHGIGGAFERWLPYSTVWLGAANLIAGFLLTTLMFAMIYKFLSYARPDWSDVGVGAAITAALFTAGKYLIGLYLGRAAVGSSFGAAGSFVVLLFWIYYSSLILLFGAEFTQVYAQSYGSGLTPAGRRRGLAAHAPA